MSNHQLMQKNLDWTHTLTCTDDDTGDRTDLTGLSIEVQIRRVTSGANLLSYTVGSGITLSTQSGATQGQAVLVVPALDSADLETANHVYRVLVDGELAMDWVKLTVRP
jgi:hypothetical protein